MEESSGMKKAVEEGMKTDINPLLFAIPMLCDASASTLQLIGYINIPASIAQMMMGFVILVVAILSIIFLKAKQYRHHWVGIFFIFGGIVMVAATAFTSKNDTSTKNPLLGVSMMAISIVIQGIQYIVEEKLLGSYYLNPMKVVGWEGIYGIILFCILLSIFQFIPCEAEICINGVLEDSRLAFRQIGNSGELLFYVISNIIFVAGMIGLGMVITKYVSSGSRVTLSQAKTIIIWGFFLIAPAIVDMRVSETFSFLQLGGFIIMLLGIVLYNEILVLPFLGMNKYIKANLEKDQLRSKSLDYDSDDEISEDSKGNLMINDATDYAPSSPKPYDYQRNYKRLKKQMELKASKNNETSDTYMRIDED